jgi:geranylgeranyl pyrophosphate synthase
VLDDLPSMDDAQTRRGKPCAHLVFPRWACDMLPAYLVNLAYAVTLRNDRVEAERRIVSALALAHAGLSMCRGQESDITQAARGSADIEACYLHKSAALYAAAAEVGARLAGADPASAERLHACGLDLGMSYQFQDDIADVEAKETDIGKTVRRDVGKRTAVSLFGLEETRRRAGRFLESALARIEGLGPEADSLRSLIRQASWASP